MNRILKNSVDLLNEAIDKAIIEGDMKTFKRLSKLHKSLVIEHLHEYIHQG
jgi:hypothetical protein